MTRLSHRDMAVEIGKMAHAKQMWLHGFSSGKTKRPDFEIETKRKELVVLQQAQDDYDRAASRAV